MSYSHASSCDVYPARVSRVRQDYCSSAVQLEHNVLDTLLLVLLDSHSLNQEMKNGNAGLGLYILGSIAIKSRL
jgi:hypothetical protein